MWTTADRSRASTSTKPLQLSSAGQPSASSLSYPPRPLQRTLSPNGLRPIIPASRPRHVRLTTTAWSYSNDKGNLKKSMCGRRQRVCNWFLMLKDRLLAHDFQQSCIDLCRIGRDSGILQVYTDDTLLFGRTQQALTNVITNLQTDLTLKDKGEVHDFLGIRIDRAANTKLLSS